jgi:hypothetical protein
MFTVPICYTKLHLYNMEKSAKSPSVSEFSSNCRSGLGVPLSGDQNKFGVYKV